MSHNFLPVPKFSGSALLQPLEIIKVKNGNENLDQSWGKIKYCSLAAWINTS